MLLLFDSTRDVILAEKLLSSKKIICKVIPVPREISTQCGMALEIAEDKMNNIIEIFQESSINPKIYHVPLRFY